jgi:hypothetical protein
MVLAYREFVDLVSPDIVMVVYIDDDVFRVFESYRGTEAMSKPGFELVDGRLTLRTRDHTGAFERLAQVSIIANRFYKHVYRPRESERVVRAFFVELARETRARGQRLVVVRYPTAGDVLRNWEQVFDFSALFEHEGVTYIDPQDSMRAAGVVNDGLYLPDDAHPGVEGNRFVARYIVRHAALEH